MQPAHTSEEETLELWYELGRLYSGSEGSRNRATMLGFTVVCLAGALVLLSGYFFGTTWAGATPKWAALGAAMLPVVVGVLGGASIFGRGRLKSRRQEQALRQALAERDEDAERPTRDGLHAYYDAQLVLLRSEYEFLRLQGNHTARLFEETFGFTPEDGFETGPLNVTPDSKELRRLRGLWEHRVATLREGGLEAPALGIEEDLTYRVFPREMTVPVELATRNAYLTISCELIKSRYGKKPLGNAPAELRRRIERDLGEHAALTRKV